VLTAADSSYQHHGWTLLLQPFVIHPIKETKYGQVFIRMVAGRARICVADFLVHLTDGHPT
jgi:hypothetical protein